MTAFDFKELPGGPKPAEALTPTGIWIEVQVVGRYTNPAKDAAVVGFRVRSLTTRVEWDAPARDVRGRRA